MNRYQELYPLFLKEQPIWKRWYHRLRKPLLEDPENLGRFYKPGGGFIVFLEDLEDPQKNPLRK